jgi:hypothetical protein
MPQHVAVDQERETSSLAGTGNHPLIARNAQWRTPLGNKDVDARGFPLQPAQCSQLPRGQWLPSAYTALGAPHMQRRGLPVDVIPTQAHKLAGAQPVTVGQQDRSRVTMPPTVLPSRIHELFDFALGQIIAGRLNCYICCCRRLSGQVQICQGFPPVPGLNCCKS